MKRGLLRADHHRAGRLAPPLSKSDAQRCLAIAHALGSDAVAEQLRGARPASLAADVLVLDRALKTLRNGRFPCGIDCQDGGAPFRIALTQAAITPGAEVHFTGSARLGERPHEALVKALMGALGPAGLALEFGNPWPLVVRAPASTGVPRFQVSGTESSQYASSLLLGAAALTVREQRTWSVELTTPITSEGYLEMTVGWMRRAGFVMEEEGQTFHVRSGAMPAAPLSIPGDWSSLGYLLLAAWKTGSVVTHVDPDAIHPDRAVLRFLTDVGLSVAIADGEARVTGAAQRGLIVSAKECPDSIPTLAALACVLPESSRFEDVAVLQLKESDRLAGIEALVAAVGGESSRDGNSLVVTPPGVQVREFSIDVKGDHRMAMAASTLALLLDATVELSEPMCVAKSFPDFFEQLAAIGITLEELV